MDGSLCVRILLHSVNTLQPRELMLCWAGNFIVVLCFEILLLLLSVILILFLLDFMTINFSIPESKEGAKQSYLKEKKENTVLQRRGYNWQRMYLCPWWHHNVLIFTGVCTDFFILFMFWMKPGVSAGYSICMCASLAGHCWKVVTSQVNFAVYHHNVLDKNTLSQKKNKGKK